MDYPVFFRLIKIAGKARSAATPGGVIPSDSIFGKKKYVGVCFDDVAKSYGCFVNTFDHFGLSRFQKGWEIMILMVIFSLNNHLS